MLKIKDEVDLKELEKFGFEFNNGTGKYVFSIRYPAGNGGMEIIVKFWDRKIYVWSNTNCIKDEAFLDIMYDLIQAGLVEKIEG